MTTQRIRPSRTRVVSRRAIAGFVMAWAGTSAGVEPIAALPDDGGATFRNPRRVGEGGVPHGIPRQVAQAATVSTCADAGTGSLRAAVAANAALIDMTSLGCSTISLTTGELVADVGVTDLTLNGPLDHVLTIDANHLGAILVHEGGGTLTLDHVKLTNGAGTNFTAFVGGCIYSLGSVTLQNSTISNCILNAQDATRGGAVYAHVDLTLNDSVLSGNVAQSTSGAALGGAAFVGGKLLMNRSTIRDNTALSNSAVASGGGAYVRGEARLYAATVSGNQSAYEGGLAVLSKTTIYNSTISGNYASLLVGGVYAKGLLSLDNSTVAFNAHASTQSGAGVYATLGVIAHSSIAANNTCTTSAQHCDIECKGCSISGSNNLIMAANVALPPGTIVVDPMLAALASNGGPAKTHAPLPGSPVLDKGSNIRDFLFDQRGHPRSFGLGPDIGAFESESDLIFVDGFD